MKDSVNDDLWRCFNLLIKEISCQNIHNEPTKTLCIGIITQKNTHPFYMLPCDITPTIYINGLYTKIYRSPWHIFLFSCCLNPWGADLWFDKCISKNIGYTLSKKDMLQTNQKSNNNRNKSNCNREKYSQPIIIINKHRIFFEFQMTLSTCIQCKIVQKVISSKTSGC